MVKERDSLILAIGVVGVLCIWNTRRRRVLERDVDYLFEDLHGKEII